MTLIPRRGRDIRKGDVLLRYMDNKEVFAHIYAIEECNSKQITLISNIGRIVLYKDGVYSIISD